MSVTELPMAQLITVRLNKSDSQPLGFRLQGGKDFGTPLVVQKPQSLQTSIDIYSGPPTLRTLAALKRR
ncbi:hypothetical protein HW555_005151 [Spodoptera exigua]|uniref:PDZ domain-containing protein n=1 Tax=Spodoptera exigua TaxID=7107 RepID=A0A835GL19_SPOEX|nr:hypothetical protein HW555_005151 [Spodoptera exigua]